MEAEHPETILCRVGNVLIVAGIADIACMIYVISSGHGYSSGLNVFGVIAGVLLRRNSLRTARTVRLSAAFTFAAFLGLLVALPIAIPVDLIRTWLRITPTSQIVGWGTLFLALLALLWWVYRSLGAAAVDAAIQAADLGRERFWHRPRSCFVAGACLVAMLAILLPLSNRTESARQAIERARSQLGPGYRYFVGSLSTSWSGASGTHVRALVLAYTDSSIESVDLEWRE